MKETVWADLSNHRRRVILSASQKATTTKTPRKRVRVSKKETDRVYSASQGNGENFDMKKRKPPAIIKKRQRN